MTEPTTERLAKALEGAGAPPSMVQRARDGYYDDYKSPLPAPTIQLVQDCLRLNLPEIANAALVGDFDGTFEEAQAWLASEEGQGTVHALRDFLERRDSRERR